MTRDGTAEPISRDQTLRRERGQVNNHFLCSADHKQDWQPYPVVDAIRHFYSARVIISADRGQRLRAPDSSVRKAWYLYTRTASRE